MYAGATVTSAVHRIYVQRWWMFAVHSSGRFYCCAHLSPRLLEHIWPRQQQQQLARCLACACLYHTRCPVRITCRFGYPVSYGYLCIIPGWCLYSQQLSPQVRRTPKSSSIQQGARIGPRVFSCCIMPPASRAWSRLALLDKVVHGLAVALPLRRFCAH